MAKLDVERHGDLIAEIVLSERNLLSLLTKLYDDSSEKTIIGGNVVRGEVQLLGSFSVRAEKDDIHYGDATRNAGPAGKMHPDTEKILNLIKNA